jgi:hypothetical protein
MKWQFSSDNSIGGLGLQKSYGKTIQLDEQHRRERGESSVPGPVRSDPLPGTLGIPWSGSVNIENKDPDPAYS